MSQTQNGSNPYASTNSYPTSFEPPSNFTTPQAGFAQDGTASLSGNGQIGQTDSNQYSGFSAPASFNQSSYTAPNDGYNYQNPTQSPTLNSTLNNAYTAPTTTNNQFGTQQNTTLYDSNSAANSSVNSPAANSGFSTPSADNNSYAYSGYGQSYDQTYSQYNNQGYTQNSFSQPGADTANQNLGQGLGQNLGQNPAMEAGANGSYMGGYGTENNLNTATAPAGSAYNYNGYDQASTGAAQYSTQYGGYGSQYDYSGANINTTANATTNPDGSPTTPQNPAVPAPNDTSNFTVSSSGNRNFYIVSGIIIVILIITTVVLLVIQNGRSNSQETSSSSSTASVAVSTPVSSSSSSIAGFSTSSIPSIPTASSNSSSLISGQPVKKNNDQKLSAVWLKQKFPQTDLNMDGLCANPTKCGETVDPDADGLNNIEEYNYQTDPLNEDTAGSGISDGDKIKIYNLDPNRKDSNGNGTSDGADIVACLDPLNRSGSKLTQAQQKLISDNTKLYNLNSATIKTLQSAGATTQDLSAGLILANCSSSGGLSSMPSLPTPPPVGVGSSSSSSSQSTADDNDVGISFN